MKKYVAVMVAVLFVFCMFGVSYAQNTSVEKAKPAAEPSPLKKGQQMTPEKKAASESPAVGEGAAKSDTKPVKKSEKAKKRQAQTPEKKKASESPKAKQGEPAKP